MLFQRIPMDRAGLRSRLLAAAILGAVIAVSFLYRGYVNRGPTLCMFRVVTGVPCPGCGMTRSFCAIAEGEMGKAFDFHILGPFLYGAILLAIPLILIEAFLHVRVIPIYRWATWSRLPYLLLVVLFVYHAVRLIDMAQSGEILSNMQESLMGTLYRWLEK